MYVSCRRLWAARSVRDCARNFTHEAITVTSQYEDFHRQETGWSGLLYKCATAKYTHKLARLDLATPCDMRAPSAAPGVYALECAMDELAVALRLDPLELSLRYYSGRDQHNDRPYSSKSLRDCYGQGAEAFGWGKRTPEPRSMRDGTELVGWGMATGIWEALQTTIAVRIVLSANGHAEVSCATSDIGIGSYTIMAQVAADMLGLPLDNVTIKLGDSTLPQSPVEGGSWIAASVSNGIMTTSDAVRKRIETTTNDVSAFKHYRWNIGRARQPAASPPSERPSTASTTSVRSCSVATAAISNTSPVWTTSRLASGRSTSARRTSSPRCLPPAATIPA
jgi:CO/xanthine dehydrogenase Mo-binding subunit